LIGLKLLPNQPTGSTNRRVAAPERATLFNLSMASHKEVKKKKNI